MKYIRQIKAWVGEIIEISLLLVALGIVIEVVIGHTLHLFAGVTVLIALNVVLCFSRRKKIFHDKTM